MSSHNRRKKLQTNQKRLTFIFNHVFALTDNLHVFFHVDLSHYLMGWKKHELESRLPGDISITSDM